MDSVSVREARRRLSEIVAAAEQGQSVVITRRGRRVARVGPAGPVKAKGLPDLTEFRRCLTVRGKPLSKTVIEARRRERF
jgi:prevent-host-death family protein